MNNVLPSQRGWESNGSLSIYKEVQSIFRLTSLQREIEDHIRQEKNIGEFCYGQAVSQEDEEDQHFFAREFDKSEKRYQTLRKCLLCTKRLLATAGVVTMLTEKDHDSGCFTDV